MKRDQNTECGSCNSKDHWLLHNIPQRDFYSRLCTSCVLKHHPGLFCPNCFEVYEGFNPPSNGVTCFKCLSVSHLTCVSKETTPSSYVCRTCRNPSHIFFDSNKKSKDGNENHLAIDLNMAKVLLAAAQIASFLMNKAVSAARIDADKKVEEAYLTRKKAIEAMEEVNVIASREKEKRKDGKEMKTMDVVPSSSVVVEDEQKKKSRGNSAVAAAVAAQKRFQNQVIMAVNDGKDKDKDKSGKTPVFLDKAASSEIKFYSPKLEQKPPTNGLMGHQQLQRPATVNGKEKPGNFSHSQNGVVQDKEKNGLVSVAHGVEENQEKSKEFGKAGMVPQPTHLNKGAFVSKTNEGVLLPTGSSKTAS